MQRQLTLHIVADVLKAVRQSEKKNGIRPDCDLDAFMKAQATEGRNGHVNSELILRLLGLQVPILQNLNSIKSNLVPLIRIRYQPGKSLQAQ